MKNEHHEPTVDQELDLFFSDDEEDDAPTPVATSDVYDTFTVPERRWLARRRRLETRLHMTFFGSLSLGALTASEYGPAWLPDHVGVVVGAFSGAIFVFSAVVLTPVREQAVKELGPHLVQRPSREKLGALDDYHEKLIKGQIQRPAEITTSTQALTGGVVLPQKDQQVLDRLQTDAQVVQDNIAALDSLSQHEFTALHTQHLPELMDRYTKALALASTPESTQQAEQNLSEGLQLIAGSIHSYRITIEQQVLREQGSFGGFLRAKLSRSELDL